MDTIEDIIESKRTYIDRIIITENNVKFWERIYDQQIKYQKELEDRQDAMIKQFAGIVITLQNKIEWLLRLIALLIGFIIGIYLKKW